MKFSLLLTLFIINFSVFAQKEIDYKTYFLDKNYNSIKELKDASHILLVTKMKDSCYQYLYYSTFSLVAEIVENYKDEDGTIPNGTFGYYNTNGYLDSLGTVKDGKRDGGWYYYDAYGKKPDSVIAAKEYKEGRLLVREKPNNYVGINTEPKFVGSFKKFLEKNLTYPNNAIETKQQGKVVVSFTVDKDSNITDIIPQKSRNLFLDIEAMRIIKLSSKKWTPGYQNGIAVKSYHSQSIDFVID
jgi:TonB family protein